MKSRSSLSKIVIVSVVIILVIVLSVGLFSGKYSSYIHKGGVKNNPQGIVFVPKRSPLMVSLLINPDKLGVIANLLPSNDEQKRVLRSIELFRTKLLSQAQVDSPDDLQDWLGDEITFAVTSLDYDHNPDNGIKSGYLLAVKHKSADLAREFLQTYYGKQAVSNSAQLILDEYKGVKLVYQQPLIPDTEIKQVAAAVIGDFVLFANEIQVLKEALNNAQAIDLNLAHDLAYQSSIESLPKEKVSIAYFNLPSTSAWVTNQGEVSNPQSQSLTLSLALNPQGLVTYSRLFGMDDTENQAPKLSTTPQTLAYIPDNSILSVAGVDLQGFWQDIKGGLNNNNPLPQLLWNAIHPLEESLNIDFDEDIFPQVTGEYGLSLSINKQTQDLDWLFINETGLTDKLDNLAKESGLSVGTLPLKDNTITAWTKLVTTSDNNFSRLEAQVKGVHTQKDSYEILTNSVNVLSDILSNPNHNLLESEEFRSSISGLSSENDGYLYLQWQPLKPYLVKKFPIVKIAELGFKPLFDNLQSLIITSEGVENGVKKGTIFFNLSSSK
ncbi:DUF3352 domain-containing protein [Geminocystis sp. CENA526]|uniref:DUF3352 domain-containing protein n=1 Tax=Geminocystis sp. CENA526 TaxID=1355871 RepID=UPI003D6FAA18